MILNGLGYVNKQLYLTPFFFKDKPLQRLFGRDVEALWFNDDTLGRTPDKLFDYGVSELYEKIAKKALEVLTSAQKALQPPHYRNPTLNLGTTNTTAKSQEILNNF